MTADPAIKAALERAANDRVRAALAEAHRDAIAWGVGFVLVTVDSAERIDPERVIVNPVGGARAAQEARDGE
jgi:hypothetical protein